MSAKVSKFRRIITFITIFGFMWTQISFAYAQRLTPKTFSQLYSLAQEGDLTSIKYAMSRGLNINSVNQYGNTGICEAVLRVDYKAYNTFYAAGANPKPMCIYQIDTAKYQKFMASRFVTPVRGAITYSAAEYSTTSLFAWVAGAGVIGGGAYLAFGGSDDEKDKPTACDGNPCGENGKCVLDAMQTDGFMCECDYGYVSGTVTKQCIAQGECQGNDNCSYMNGVCSVQTGTCGCADDYILNGEGKCIFNVCQGVDCGNGECKANADASSYVCECSGTDKLLGGICVDEDYCENDTQCSVANGGNGGVCSINNTCVCPESAPENNAGYCTIDPCFEYNCGGSNGTCNVVGGVAQCQCFNGYTGNNCETQLPSCPSGASNCGTYGECYDSGGGSLKCQCDDGSLIDYSAAPCLEPATPLTCASKYCGEGGECEDLGNGNLQCRCNDGSVASFCEGTTPPTGCTDNSTCGAGQACSNGSCVNNCSIVGSNPCVSPQVCNKTTGQCETSVVDTGECSVPTDCEAWETCQNPGESSSVCDVNPGECGTASDCGDTSLYQCTNNICELQDGKCLVAGDCGDTNLYECANNNCKLQNGKCLVNTDCDIGQICNSSNDCENDTTPPTDFCVDEGGNTDCQTSASGGAVNSCANNADNSGFVCTCGDGYTGTGGQSCVEIVADPCADGGNDACQTSEGNTCTPSGTSFICSCDAPGYVLENGKCVFETTPPTDQCDSDGDCASGKYCNTSNQCVDNTCTPSCETGEICYKGECKTLSSSDDQKVVIDGKGTTVNGVSNSMLESYGDVSFIYKPDIGAPTTDETYVNNGQLDASVKMEGQASSVNLAAIGVSSKNTVLNDGLVSLISGDGKDATVNPVKLYGMYAILEGTVINLAAGYTAGGSVEDAIYIDGQSNPNVSGYGMYATGVGTSAINKGNINISEIGVAYGMYADKGATIQNEGEIRLSGNLKSYGMYADGSTIVNTQKGVIDITTPTEYTSGNNHYGIYAINSSKVINEGTITINGVSKTAEALETLGKEIPVDGRSDSFYIYLDASSVFTNDGALISKASLNLDDFAGRSMMMLGANSQISSDEAISGKAMIAPSVVAEGQKDLYTINNAFSAKDIDVELFSPSAFFSPTLVENGSSMDAQLQRLSFVDVMADATTAKFLEQNYGSGHALYNGIMTAGSGQEASAIIDALGADVLSNISQQNMNTYKSLNAQIENNIIREQDFNKEENVYSGYSNFHSNADSEGNSSGYDDDASSIWTMFDKKINSHLRYGLGMAFTKYESDYYDGSNRDEFSYNLYGMIAYKKEDWVFLSVPNVGIGFGQYERKVGSETFDGDLTTYYYGLSNSVRKSIAFANGYKIEPMLSLNITGIYQGKIKEDNQISTKAENNLSVEAGIGLYLSKEYKIDENQMLRFRFGGMLYQELISNPFADMNASVNGLSGYYIIDPRKDDKTRQTINANLIYRYKNIDVNADFSKFVDKTIDNGYTLGVNFKYNF